MSQTPRLPRGKSPVISGILALGTDGEALVVGGDSPVAVLVDDVPLLLLLLLLEAALLLALFF